MWCHTGSWEGRVPFLDCPSSVQTAWKLCGLSSLSEVLPLPGVEALILGGTSHQLSGLIEH